MSYRKGLLQRCGQREGSQPEKLKLPGLAKAGSCSPLVLRNRGGSMYGP